MRVASALELEDETSAELLLAQVCSPLHYMGYTVLTALVQCTHR